MTPTPTTATQERGKQATDKNVIRPFQVNVPEAELTELRRRINATRWPERETVTDHSQGVQLATVRKLASDWAADYDWRKEGRAQCAAAVHHRDCVGVLRKVEILLQSAAEVDDKRPPGPAAERHALV